MHAVNGEGDTGLTVRDVWKGVLPPGTELLGGGAGLERRVDWAIALRTRPPAFDAIKGGEIAFIPVKRLRLVDERLDLAQVMRSFAEKGGAGVAIVGDASAEGIAVAEQMMLPLLKLPDSAPIADTHHAAVRFILDQRGQLHEKEHELRVALTELALAGAGPAEILDRLVDIVGGTAVWQDEDGTVRHCIGEVDVTPAAIRAELAAMQRWAASSPLRASEPPVRAFSAAELTRYVSPVPVRDRVGGFVSVFVTGDDGVLARLGAMRAASACAIEFERERAVLAARDDLEGEFVSALVSGAYTSEDAIVERGRRLGFDAHARTVVVVVGGAARIPDGAILAARKWCERRAPGGLVAVHGDQVCVVLPAADERDPGETARELRAECAVAVGKGHPLAAGISRPHEGIGGVRNAFREAEQTIALGRRLYGDTAAVSFADLGLHRLLHAMRDHPELLAFYDEHLGVILAYEARHRGELIPTLESFFRCRGSPTEIAGDLKLHRNTVLYRLRRIEEIAHVSLDDARTRLNLHLALRIADVVGAGGQRPASHVR